jgi:hypothetical protein
MISIKTTAVLLAGRVCYLQLPSLELIPTLPAGVEVVAYSPHEAFCEDLMTYRLVSEHFPAIEEGFPAPIFKSMEDVVTYILGTKPCRPETRACASVDEICAMLKAGKVALADCKAIQAACSVFLDKSATKAIKEPTEAELQGFPEGQPELQYSNWSRKVDKPKSDPFYAGERAW